MMTYVVASRWCVGEGAGGRRSEDRRGKGRQQGRDGKGEGRGERRQTARRKFRGYDERDLVLLGFEEETGTREKDDRKLR